MRDKADGTKPPKPKLYSGDLANPPAELQPLLVRPQWAIWRLTWDGTRWTKPPFQARDPQRHASSADPNTWADYSTAVAAAAEHGNGVSYVLTAEDELAAADIDHVRNPRPERSLTGRSACSIRQGTPTVRSVRPAPVCESGALQPALRSTAHSSSRTAPRSSYSGARASR